MTAEDRQGIGRLGQVKIHNTRSLAQHTDMVALLFMGVLHWLVYRTETGACVPVWMCTYKPLLHN